MIDLEKYLTFGAEIEFYFSKRIEIEDASIYFQKLHKDMKLTKEDGYSQYELILPYFHAKEDLGLLIKEAKKHIYQYAETLGIEAYIITKPFPNEAISSMHIHIGFQDDLFDKYYKFAIGGILYNLNNMLHVLCPKERDLIRFYDNSIHVPKTISWGYNNRSVAIRIPDNKNKRLEFRVIAPDADFEAVINALIKSINYGINNNISPPPPTYGIAHDDIYNPKFIVPNIG